MAMFDLSNDEYGRIFNRNADATDPYSGGQFYTSTPGFTEKQTDVPSLTDPGQGGLSADEGYRLAHQSPTGFYTNSPGPLYNTSGQQTSPQPSIADVYATARGQGGPGTSFDTLRNLYGSYGYNAQPYMYGSTPSGNELNINGQKYKFTVGDVGQPGTSWYDWNAGDSNTGGGGGGGGYTGGGAPAGGSYSGGGIFDDPATKQFMDLLSSRINALNQPYQPASLGPLTDYLKSYFEKLQGPAYTPQQLDLLQTQSLDPLSRERDAARQRVLEGASARGLNPQSGIVQKQISDLENKFEQIRTQTQSGFAAKAVDLDRINAQQAASVGQLLANIEQANFTGNENRANQALGYAQLVPEMAMQRLGAAGTLLGQNTLNPASLLSSAQGFGQLGLQQSAQTQQFLAGLMQLVPGLLKAFGL